MSDEVVLDEMMEAGELIANLLVSTLMPLGYSWDKCRAPAVWEYNALCWLHRNRERAGPINDWVESLLQKGYPPKPSFDMYGNYKPAGAYWNNGSASIPTATGS